MIKELKADSEDHTHDILTIKPSKTYVKFHAYVDQYGNTFKMKKAELLQLLQS